MRARDAEMMEMETRGYAHRVDIRAELTAVWQALIEPSGMARWQGRARVDAREGGSYELLADAQRPRVAHIDVFRPPHRLRLIYLPSADYPQREAVIVDDLLLDRASIADAGGAAIAVTVVRLLGSGIPGEREWDVFYARVRAQWEQALLRLKAAFERPAVASAGSAKR